MTMKLEKYFLLLALGVFAFALQAVMMTTATESPCPRNWVMRWPGSIPVAAYRMGNKRCILCG